MQPMFNYIRKEEPTNTNSIKGVVTPYDQMFRKKENTGFSLLEVLENENISKNFDKFTYPDIISTDDGKKWIDSVSHVISPNGERYIKWLLFTKDKKPVHDHDYPMTILPEDGYLVKITIPVREEEPREFTVDYIIDLTDIHFNIESSVNTLSGDENANDIYHLIPNDVPEIQDFMRQERFFDDYLSYIVR